jgi:hypothetical protein
VFVEEEEVCSLTVPSYTARIVWPPGPKILRSVAVPGTKLAAAFRTTEIVPIVFVPSKKVTSPLRTGPAVSLTDATRGTTVPATTVPVGRADNATVVTACPYAGTVASPTNPRQIKSKTFK